MLSGVCSVTTDQCNYRSGKGVTGGTTCVLQKGRAFTTCVCSSTTGALPCGHCVWGSILTLCLLGRTLFLQFSVVLFRRRFGEDLGGYLPGSRAEIFREFLDRSFSRTGCRAASPAGWMVRRWRWLWSPGVGVSRGLVSAEVTCWLLPCGLVVSPPSRLPAVNEGGCRVVQVGTSSQVAAFVVPPWTFG